MQAFRYGGGIDEVPLAQITGQMRINLDQKNLLGLLLLTPPNLQVFLLFPTLSIHLTLPQRGHARLLLATTLQNKPKIALTIRILIN